MKLFSLFKKKKKYLSRSDYQKNIKSLIYKRDFQGMAGTYKFFDMFPQIIEVEYKGNHIIFYKNFIKKGKYKKIEKLKIWKDEKFENKENWETFLNYDI